MIAVLSEVHGNLEAFEAVSKTLESYDSIQKLVCLGDVLGYGPNPNEVVDLFRRLEERFEIAYCMGNHDAGALGLCEFIDLSDPDDIVIVKTKLGLDSIAQIIRALSDPKNRTFSPVKKTARDSNRWTKATLSDASRQFLAERLKESLKLDETTLCVHGSPRGSVYDYVRDQKYAAKAFESPAMTGISICFVGHTHIPAIWRLRKEDRMSYAGSVILLAPPDRITPGTSPLELDTGRNCYIVNVGAVGQPRDGNPRACFVLYDPDAKTVEYVRVPYDVETTKKKIVSVGLPEELANRLGSADAEPGVVQDQ